MHHDERSNDRQASEVMLAWPEDYEEHVVDYDMDDGWAIWAIAASHGYGPPEEIDDEQKSS